jgi:hypothetical protein
LILRIWFEDIGLKPGIFFVLLFPGLKSGATEEGEELNVRNPDKSGLLKRK